MIGHLGLERSFQNRFGQLLEQTVFPDDILGLLVVGEQLINQLLVDCHGVFHFLPPIAVYTVLFTPSAPPRWVDTAISARTADISPSRITRVATGIAHAARATPASAGSRHGNGNCCPLTMSTSSSHSRGNSLRSHCRTSD